jgi:hypothetical protein
VRTNAGEPVSVLAGVAAEVGDARRLDAEGVNP